MSKVLRAIYTSLLVLATVSMSAAASVDLNAQDALMPSVGLETVGQQTHVVPGEMETVGQQTHVVPGELETVGQQTHCVPPDIEAAIQHALIVSPDVALARLKVIEAQLSLTEAQLNQGGTGTLADLFHAEQAMQEARMSYIDVLKDVAHQVEEAAYQVMRQDELLNLRRIDLEQAERRLALANARYDAGLISELEFAEIEFRRDEARWSLQSAENQVADAKERFAQLVTGENTLPPDTEINWQPRLTAPTLTVDQAIRDALETSPMVAQAVRSADAAQQRLDLAEKTFSSPVEMARAKMERDRAAINMAQVQRTVTRDVSQMFRNVESLYAQIALKEQAMQLAERRLEIVVARYQAGQAPLLDVVTAEAVGLQAQFDFTAAVWDYYTANLQLMRQIGRAELPSLPAEIQSFMAQWN